MANEWNGYENGEEMGEQDYAFQTLNRYGKPKTLGWSITSLVMGFASLFTCMFGWASIILGAVAVFFSIVSRRILGYFDGKTVFGLILGIFGAVFGTTMIIFVSLLGEAEQQTLWDIIKELYSNPDSYGGGNSVGSGNQI